MLQLYDVLVAVQECVLMEMPCRPLTGLPGFQVRQGAACDIVSSHMLFVHHFTSHEIVDNGMI